MSKKDYPPVFDHLKNTCNPQCRDCQVEEKEFDELFDEEIPNLETKDIYFPEIDLKVKVNK